MKCLNKVFDFLIPRFCVACNSNLQTEERYICNNCFSQIKFLSDSDIKSEFERKFATTDFIHDYTSLFIFEEDGKIQSLIHELKYNGKFKIGFFLGELLADGRRKHIESWDAQIIVPIPLFHLKKVDRGYNQADYIAKGLSKNLKIKYSSKIVKRIKNTLSQTKLTSSERKSNMESAFSLRKGKAIKGKKIILVDDVITTGITVLEVAKVLIENGAEKVYSLSVATPLISHTIRSRNT